MGNGSCFYQHKLLSCLGLLYAVVCCKHLPLLAGPGGCWPGARSRCGSWLLKSCVFKDLQCRAAVVPALICREWWPLSPWGGEKQSLLIRVWQVKAIIWLLLVILRGRGGFRRVLVLPVVISCFLINSSVLQNAKHPSLLPVWLLGSPGLSALSALSKIKRETADELQTVVSSGVLET